MKPICYIIATALLLVLAFSAAYAQCPPQRPAVCVACQLAQPASRGAGSAPCLQMPTGRRCPCIVVPPHDPNWTSLGPRWYVERQRHPYS
jgi:hypothetical protein